MRSNATVCALLAWSILAGCGPAGGTSAMTMVTKVERAEWRTPYATGERITTGHYRIFTTARNRLVRKYLPGFMEAAYRNYLRITAMADRPTGQQMPVYMLGTRGEWAGLTRKVIQGPVAEKYLAIQAGGYCYNGVCVFWDIRPLATLSVASHEGLHQFFHHRLKHRLPTSLEEGFCVTAEGFEIVGDAVRFTPRNNPARYNDLRRALTSGHWIGLRKLLPMDAGDVVTGSTGEAVSFYGQLWALVAFIRSRPDYRAGMQQMLTDAQAGTFHQALGIPRDVFEALLQRGKLYNRAVAEKLFRHYICDDLEAFEREFRAFASRFAGLG